MTVFIALAALLCVAGVAAVVAPLVARRASVAAPAPVAALLTAGVLVLGAALLYAHWSNWNWGSPPPGDSPQSMVARLARKLERSPEDLNGWLLLGRSYAVLQQYPLALRAYQRADRLAQGRNGDALIGEAEVLALADERELDGRAGRLAEQALAIEPDSGKALFFAGAAALHRNDLRLARERFERLLTLQPPAEVRTIIEQQLTAIAARQEGRVVASPPGPGARGAGRAGASGSGDTQASVRLTVRLAPGTQVPPGSPLFVFVRDPQRPGPPLAVKRLAAQFPQAVELRAADAMVRGRSFASGQTVQVVARIARSGNPLAATGDPFGELSYKVGSDGARDLLIDRRTP